MGEVVLAHQPCEKCGSSDAKAFYEDGSAHCFSCRANFRSSGEKVEDTQDDDTPTKFSTGSFQDIPKRKLREETCRKFGYMVGDGCQIAQYRDTNRKLVAQKIRRAGKSFSVEGNGKNMPLFGQHIWQGGKSVTITEGEIDAMSISQAFDNKWPVVSLPSGAQSAKKAIENAYDWLSGFEKIVLCFDMDEHGQKAIEDVAPILPPGKAHIMRLQRKDANEVLVEDGAPGLVRAFWDAKPWRPDGIISGQEITLESLLEASVVGYTTRYPILNEKLGGLRKREIIMLTAGSGIGKSTWARELAYGLHQDHGLIIGNVYLEESKEKTAQGYIAIDNNIPLKELRKNPSVLPRDKWEASLKNVVQTRMFFYDHFGSMASERLLQKLRYMAVVLKCDFAILDHISIVISGSESSSEGERRDIDKLMTNLRSLVEETGMGVIVITHLKQPEGKAHEEGGRVTLSHLRGSGALKQLSDTVIALERDQQNEENSNRTLIRILKEREGGDVGPADTLEYRRETGRLVSVMEGVDLDV